jgi:hypothetical protein
VQYTRLGGTGLEVSRIRLGTMTYGSSDWRPLVLDEGAARPLLARAVEAGALPAAPRPGLHPATSDGSSLADARGTPRGFLCHSRRAPVAQAPR